LSDQKFEGYGHYATFIDPDEGFSFSLHATSWDGPPKEVIIDSSLPNWNVSLAKPVFHSTSTPTSREVGIPDLEGRDICRKVGACLRTACSSTAACAVAVANTSVKKCEKVSASVIQFFKDNNYAQIKSIMVGVPIGIVINIASTPLTNALFNSKHDVVKGDKADACDLNNHAVLANDYGAAVGEFCMAIHSSLNDKNQVDTHYLAGDVAGAKPGKARGTTAVTKAFVASQAGVFGPICEELGIKW
jgi:hypothetical protein